MAIKHYDIVVKGKVQGVFFRASTKAVADQLGIRGRVRNEKDGSVCIEAEGEETFLKHFIDWCREGPEKAEVDSVLYEEGPEKGFQNFVVIKKNLLW